MKRIFLLSMTLSVLIASASATTKKAIYIVLDGIPADYIERVRPEIVFDIASRGGYSRAYTGGEIGAYSQTATISAIGYMNILTGTWYNKHNVHGNSDLDPNYNYWSIFRIAKEQEKAPKTALFSSWQDNRTVLIGEGKPETGQLKIDYVFDSYELDKTRFPDRKDELHIFEIDSIVCTEAARAIQNDAPDLSWVYLWYTDSGYHLYGDGAFMDNYVQRTDQLIKPIWEAVQYREKEFGEEWMVIVTTDHGRTESGYGHGGQSERERSCWIATNQSALNARFNSPSLALVDINPTICDFMDFELPRAVAFEQDGASFLGQYDIYDLKTAPYDHFVDLSWSSTDTDQPATIYAATTNDFKTGGQDEWIELATVPAKSNAYRVDLTALPESKFYKFVVKTENGVINRWVRK